MAAALGKVAAYFSLTKPRIVVMVLITVGVGFILGARGSAHPATMSLTLIGTALVAGSASASEPVDGAGPRRSDAPHRQPGAAHGPRHCRRSGRFRGWPGAPGDRDSPAGGELCLRPAVAVATLLLYVLVYTPLKPWTTLNTAIGAIPGALPPVIGWAAATGTLGIEALALFLIVFLWQFPHFLAIAWIYREDYARGGLKMLPDVDPHGALTARQATVYALALIPAGLLPAIVGLAGSLYFAGGPRTGGSCTSPPPSGSGRASRNRPRGGSCGCLSCICRRSFAPLAQSDAGLRITPVG